MRLVAKRSSALNWPSTEFAPIYHTTISNAQIRWQKVAKIVGTTLDNVAAAYPGCTATILAERIRCLVEEGKLEAQGDLNYLRLRDVRLPSDSVRGF